LILFSRFHSISILHNKVMAPTIPTAPTGTPLAPIPADPSLWDRISTWVSEHKAVVYTIAGVAVVVTTAGAVYYVRSSQVSSSPVIQHATPAGICASSGVPVLMRGLTDRNPRTHNPSSARRRGGNGSKPRGKPKLRKLPPPQRRPRPRLPQPRRPRLPPSSPPTSCPRLTRPQSRPLPSSSARSTHRS
jgi:hypothetical protein